MPYDPRPTTEGGNRGIDIDFSRKPPKSKKRSTNKLGKKKKKAKKFRVVGVDTFDGGDWVVGDYTTLEKAQKVVDDKTRGAQMLKMYVYDQDGKCVYSGGSY